MRHLQFRRAAAALIVLAVSAAAALAQPKAADKKKAVTDVSLKKLTLIPESVTIKVGQTVRWTNNDDRDYQLVARDRSFASGNLRPKASFEHAFAEAGRFEYACALHPRLIGTVVVEGK